VREGNDKRPFFSFSTYCALCVCAARLFTHFRCFTSPDCPHVDIKKGRDPGFPGDTQSHPLLDAEVKTGDIFFSFFSLLFEG
jgi:hypothetical protein